jgi:hypothetical protein
VEKSRVAARVWVCDTRSMNAAPRTKTDSAMETDQEKFRDDPERVQLLECARRFKASWLELAQALSETRRSGNWKRWGFETFEAYAKQELRLRPETVDKLTGSYQFLAKRAPDRLQGDALEQSVPSYQAIDFLRRAEETESAPREVVRALYNKVMDENTSLPKLKKEFEAQVFPISKSAQKEREAAGLKNVGGRLLALLNESKTVTAELKTPVIESLEALLESLKESEAA